MSNTLVVTEDGVITCPHGGKVVLSSSEPMVTCAGVKVMLVEDLVGAPIQGCPRHPPSGPTCTCVASVGASADTENNFTSKDGKKFLLRVGDCKTNCGESLILKDPGQDVWSIFAEKSLALLSVERFAKVTAQTIEAAAKALLDPPNSNDNFSILPLRKTYEENTLRSLRPMRAYRNIRNLYAVKDDDSNAAQTQNNQTQTKSNSNDGKKIKYKQGESYEQKKIATYLDSRLYVLERKSDGSDELTEYAIINDTEDVNRPLREPFFSQIYFCKVKGDEKETKRMTAIPCKWDGTYKLLYSDIPLLDENGKLPSNIDESLFTTIKIDEKARCVRDTSIIAESSKQNCAKDKDRENISAMPGENVTDPSDLEFDSNSKKDKMGQYKFFPTLKELQEKFKEKENFCVIAEITDPMGEIEDLYNDYEFSYFSHYAYNKTLFDELRAKNAYAYAQVETMDFLYSDDNEKEEFAKKLDELKKGYGDLSKAVIKEFAYSISMGFSEWKKNPYINSTPAYTPSRIAMERSLGESALAQSANPSVDILDLISSEPNAQIGSIDVDKAVYEINERSSRVSDERSVYYYDLADALDLEPIDDLGSVDHIYNSLQFIDEDFFDDYDNLEINVDGKRYCYDKGISINKYKPLILNGNCDAPAEKVLALLTFSVAFGAKYKPNRDKDKTGFNDLVQKFSELLEKIKLYPQAIIGDKTIKEIRSKLNSQEAYKSMFSGKDPFFAEYENLEETHKKVSFDPKKSYVEFKSVQGGSINPAEAIMTDDDQLLGSPKKIVEKIAEKLKSDQFKKTLKIYQDRFETLKDDQEALLNYVQYTLGTLYNLITPRAHLDAEADILSPFKENPIQEAVAFFNGKLCSHLIEQGDIETAIKIFELNIFSSYSDALFKHIVHAGHNPKHKDNIKKAFPYEKDGDENVEERRGESAAKRLGKDVSFDTKEEENLFYEYFDMVTGSGAAGVIKKADKILKDQENVYGIEGDTAEQKQRENLERFRNSQIWQSFLIGARAISFIAAIKNIIEFSSGDKKHKASEYISLASDFLAIHKELTPLAVKFLVPKSVTDQSQRALNAVRSSNAGRSFLRGIQANRVSSFISNPAHFRIFSRLAVLTVIVKTAETLNEADLKNNKALAAGDIALSAAQIGLIFLPVGWWMLVGLAASVALQRLWDLFLRDWLYNSPVELSIEKSLFYKKISATDIALNAIPVVGFFKIVTGNSDARNYISADFLSNSVGEELEFKDANEVRAYLAKLYEKDPDLYDKALKRELDELTAALRDYKIEIVGYDAFVPLKYRGTQINVYCSKKLKFSDALVKDADFIAIAYKQGASECQYYPTNATDVIGFLIDNGRAGYNRMVDNLLESQKDKKDNEKRLFSFQQQVAIFSDMLNSSAIIAAFKDFTLKFQIEYGIRNVTGNTEVRITDCKSVLLTNEDIKYVESVRGSAEQNNAAQNDNKQNNAEG